MEVISPWTAEQMLSRQVDGQRRVRPGVVRKYALIMTRGGWMATPEGIYLTKDGKLMNGQHRLAAVVQSGVPVTFCIVRNVDEAVYASLDRGAPRSPADALRIDKQLSEVARLAAVTINAAASGGGSWSLVTDDRIAVMADLFRVSHERLMEACPSKAKIFSNAPCRLAACIQDVVNGNGDYVRTVYRNLVLANVGALPPVGQAFFGSALSGRTESRSGGAPLQYDTLVRAFVVFDPLRANQSKLQVKDLPKRVKAIGELIAPTDWLDQQTVAEAA